MEQIESILEKALEALRSAESGSALEEARVRYLGRKGQITGLLRSMAQLAESDRPAFGQRVNEARVLFEKRLEARRLLLENMEQDARLELERLDITMPAKKPALGHIHPFHSTLQRLEEIFISMGFTVVEGPEVEWDKYNFELLNMPKNHPARDMQDSFYFRENMLLRTHTSPAQARTMLSSKPPIRIICPGRTYRVDDVDASHSPVFHQVEGLVVDKGIKMSDLKGTLDAFVKHMFGDHIETRLRQSYFPFTEPSAELDVTCVLCGGAGCGTCKGTGRLELLGCGMVNPNVLSMCGIDPDEYSGFAFGMGIDRMAMLRYGISDMRILFENDARFLAQF